MKIYLNNLKEDWVVDRFKKEWETYNQDITVDNPKDADVIWIIAPWLWKNVRKKYLKSKKVICSIHHIEEFKMDDKYLKDFNNRDSYVDEYHVISNKTKLQLEKLTKKKITSIPFWVNQKIFYSLEDNNMLKEKYGLPENDYLIGSFQRDSEGSDPMMPKHIKGPDQFIEIVKHLKNIHSDLTVVLTGKRREYIKNELSKINVKFSIFEMVDFDSLNELYNCLNLYIVASRIEGGPQAIMECSITKTPIISTDVGVASEILPPNSIFDMNTFKKATPDIEKSYENALKFVIPNGFQKYREMFTR